MMKSILVSNWRDVLRYAWSVRLSALAVLFIFLDVALPLLDGLLPIPRQTFAVLCGLASAGAFVARFVPQKTVSGDK